MPKLMFKEDGGFHNFSDSEVEKAIKDGWVDGCPIRQKLLDAKQKQPIAKHVEVDILPIQSEVKRSPGRPRRPSILNNGET